MPIHNWTRVPAGIFHHFHLRWIGEISDALNKGLLPSDYYALAEQQAGKFGPDVLTLKSIAADESLMDADHGVPSGDNGDPETQGGLLVAPPEVKLAGETDLAFYRQRQRSIAIRHVSDDTLVAVIEVVSPGNKTGKAPFEAFVEKATALLEQEIHLLIVDLQPPGVRDRHGMHAAIWERLTDEPYDLPTDKPLTLAAYEAGAVVRAYVEHVAPGDDLPAMPLFLRPSRYVQTPLGDTYDAAFAATPKRWRDVLIGE